VTATNVKKLYNKIMIREFTVHTFAHAQAVVVTVTFELPILEIRNKKSNDKNKTRGPNRRGCSFGGAKRVEIYT
jgi:hypothetical protein